MRKLFNQSIKVMSLFVPLLLSACGTAADMENVSHEVSALQPASDEKLCTVAFDQAHKEVYSVPTEYAIPHGWGPATDLLAENGYSWSVNTGVLTTDTLKTARTWVIAEPTAHFSDGEAAAVEAFVANGGGLLLLTDFNVQYINPVAERFGIQFTGIINYWQRIVDFEPHPVTEGLTSVLWANGASLSLARKSPATTIATFNNEPVIAVAEFGKGRVVGIADNELFARFGLEGILDPEPDQTRDNSRLLLNIAAWLTDCHSQPAAVRLCHKTGSHDVEIVVAYSAVPAHLRHGDTPGPCAAE